MDSNTLSAAAALLPELVVDSFAGGGGASEGITVALGKGPDVALNHSPHAVATHQLNHPSTLHLCQDILEVDPGSVCAGRRVGLLWASPDCTHFSRAKSGKPVDSKIRGLAWAIVEWAKTVAPRVIVVENVPEFETWGPLNKDGRPSKRQRGETFRKWVGQLRGAGYQVEWQVLRASDFGAPTTRERLFVVARNDGEEISWPEPTHGLEEDGLEPLRCASDCIQWDLIGHDVTTRGLAAKTRERIDLGTEQFVLDPELRHVRRLPDGRLVAAWIARHYGGVVGRSANEPLPTVTKVDHHGLVVTELLERAPGGAGPQDVLVDGVRYQLGRTTHRMLQPRELANAMGFGPGYQMIGTKRDQTARVGNAVCPPLAAALVSANYTPDHGELGQGRLQGGFEVVEGGQA
jgi:DNA (cytosine-5)-methyltransferase 1